MTSDLESGVDYTYLHQIGDPNAGFVDFWREEVRPMVADL